MNKTIKNAIREMRRPYQLALDATESLAKKQLSNWYDGLLEEARKTINIRTMNIDELLGLPSKLLEPLPQKNRLPNIEKYESNIEQTLNLINRSSLSNMLASLHAEIAESSKSDLLKLASEQNHLSAIAEGHSALVSAMKQLDRNDFANIYEGLGMPKYDELIMEDYVSTLSASNDFILDGSPAKNITKEITENIASGIDIKIWSLPAKKYMKYFLLYVFLPYLSTMVAAYHYDYLINGSKMIENEKQAIIFSKTTSNKFGVEAFTNYRITKRNLHLRAESNTTSEILETLPIGTILFMVNDSIPYWLRVEVDIEGETIEGWVSKKFTTKFQ